MSTKSYALKQISVRQIEQEELVDYLQNEIFILTQCEHPNIIQLYCVFYEDSFINMILELCNKSLLQVMNEQKLSEAQSKDFMRQILSAVSYLHGQEQSIIHRDLKPGNIFLKNGWVKIADFGWSNFQGVR